ncbi:PQQ-binding-like beta-propeller repeat protein [Nocardiopsis valliformis]|uniref:hypothetical protein n=1 Tax=Nocardiopsis valliformis TaxID=239974 RepID=UPI0003462DBF|nr:hypothetical protein [Nocardiopsis valliformis]
MNRESEGGAWYDFRRIRSAGRGMVLGGALLVLAVLLLDFYEAFRPLRVPEELVTGLPWLLLPAVIILLVGFVSYLEEPGASVTPEEFRDAEVLEQEQTTKASVEARILEEHDSTGKPVGWWPVLWAVFIALVMTVPLVIFFPTELFAWTAEEPRDHTPSAFGVAMLLGYAAMALGAWALAAVQRPARRRDNRSFRVPFVAAMVLVLFLWVPAALTTNHQEVIHTIAEPGEPALVPGTVTETAWTWEAPEDDGYRRVVAGARGPVIVFEDGMTSLDGATGEELWTYRHSHGLWDRAGVIDGGERAFVEYRHYTWFDSERRVVLLDTVTGEIISDFSMPAGDVVHGSTVQIRKVKGRPDEGQPAFFVYGVGSGELLWEYKPEGETGQACRHEDVFPHLGHVLLTQVCVAEEVEDEVLWDFWLREEHEEELAGVQVDTSVIALDSLSGDPVWERTWTVDVLDRYAYPAHMALGGAPMTEGARNSLRVLLGQGDPDYVIDPATGEDVAEPAAHRDHMASDTSVVVHVQPRSVTGDEPLMFRETAEADGGGVLEAEVPSYSKYTSQALRGSLLTLQREEASADPFLLVTPIEEDTEPWEVSIGPVPDGWVDSVEMLPTPGAVVVRFDEGETLYGLVP